MKVIILMAGPHLSRDYVEPPVLLSTHGKMVIELLSEKLEATLEPKDVIGIIREMDIQKFHLHKIFDLAFPGSKVISVKNLTKGAACSALLAIDAIDSKEELLIISGDELIEIDFKETLVFFRNKKVDVGTVSFDSFHPGLSFALLAKDNEVEFVSEKRPISKHALVSFWYFRTAQLFIDGAKEMIRKNNSVNDVFYISPVLNEIILKDGKVICLKIDPHKYIPLKNDVQIRAYLENR